MLSGSSLATLQSIPSTGPAKKHVLVSFFNVPPIAILADAKSRLCDIESQAAIYLQSHGLRDEQLFGLAILIDNEFVFVDGDKKLSKYCSRQWKASSTGLDHHGNPLLEFQYRVKYYLDGNMCIRESFSRQYYYLQLKQNLLNYDQIVEEETIFRLASLSIRADYGDCSKDERSRNGMDVSSYVPSSVLEEYGPEYCLERVNEHQAKLKGVSSTQAQSEFIRVLSQPDSAHNFHLYKLRKRKSDTTPNVAISISDSGIGLFEAEEGLNNQGSPKWVQSFLWTNIEDLSFDKKKFEIRTRCFSSKLTFYTTSDEKSKHLLHLCRLTHTHHFNENRFRRFDLSHSLNRGYREELLLNRQSTDEPDSSISPYNDVIESSIGSLEATPSCEEDYSSSSGIESEDFEDIQGFNSINNEQSDVVNSSNLNVSWEVHSDKNVDIGFERTPNYASSSSSQKSSSTVRSHYSLVPSRQCHELALGAELADIKLAPNLPNLADIPAMADDDSHNHGSLNNCCSTCYNDTTSLASDEEDEGDNTIGTEPSNFMSQIYEDSLISKSTNDHNDLSLISDHGTKTGIDMQDEVYEVPGESGILFGEGLDYKNIQREIVDAVIFDDKSMIRTDNPGNQIRRPKSTRSTPVEEVETLDYSVESAQDSIYSHIPMPVDIERSVSFVDRNSHRYTFSDPMPASMSKITTIAPINIVQSKVNHPSTGSDPVSNSRVRNINNLSEYSSEVLTSEAQARFITSKPRITILTAHTQLASTTAPSFSSVPLTRSLTHTLPQVMERCCSDNFHSLQRSELPEPKHLRMVASDKKKMLALKKGLRRNVTLNEAPVIDKNHYLLFHPSSIDININSENTHPKHQVPKIARSLYLKNQKRKLQQQTVQNNYPSERYPDNMLNQNINQPHVYAQGVGVPLMPCPNFTECHPNSSQFHHPQYQANTLISCAACHASSNKCNSRPYYLQMNTDLQGIENEKQFIPHAGRHLNRANNSLNTYSCCVSESKQEQTAGDKIFPRCYCSNNQGADMIPYKPNLATVYTNQVTKSQIEQFKAQLYSDTDYVIYPHKDPAISRQEYIDAKQGQVLASQAQRCFDKKLCNYDSQMASLISCDRLKHPCMNEKSSLVYKSSPDVGLQACGSYLSSYPSYLSLASQNSTHKPGSSSGYSSMARDRYFSQQSLASSFSSFPSIHSASTQSLSGGFDPYSDISTHYPSAVIRARSDESILSSNCLLENEYIDDPHTSLPHQPTSTPYRPKSRNKNGKKSRCATPKNEIPANPIVTLQQVRERASQLDAPLLAALCSDSSLLQQSVDESTNELTNSLSTSIDPVGKNQSFLEQFHSNLYLESNDAMHNTSGSLISKGKYLLSGVYTTNQFPAPQLLVDKSNNKDKNRPVFHQHPKSPVKQMTKVVNQSRVKRGTAL